MYNALQNSMEKTMKTTVKLFNTFESAKKHLQDNNYKQLNNYSFKEDIYMLFRRRSKIVALKPFRQNYEFTKYQLETIKGK